MAAYDKQRHWDYVARVEGYVDKLFVFSRGETVEKNAPLLTIYSPDLLTTQKEFVDLLQRREGPDPRPLVTHLFKLSEYGQAIEANLHRGKHRSVKAVFDLRGGAA